MFGALAGNVFLSCQQFDVVLRIYFFAVVCIISLQLYILVYLLV